MKRTYKQYTYIQKKKKKFLVFELFFDLGKSYATIAKIVQDVCIDI